MNFNIVEQQDQKLYSLTLSSISIFILMELALAKKKYTENLFHESLNNLYNIYLPVGTQKPDIIP